MGTKVAELTKQVGYKSRRIWVQKSFFNMPQKAFEGRYFLMRARDKHLTGYVLITSIARACALGWFFSLLKWVGGWFSSGSPPFAALLADLMR